MDQISIYKKCYEIINKGKPPSNLPNYKPVSGHYEFSKLLPNPSVVKEDEAAIINMMIIASPSNHFGLEGFAPYQLDDGITAFSIASSNRAYNSINRELTEKMIEIAFKFAPQLVENHNGFKGLLKLTFDKSSKSISLKFSESNSCKYKICNILGEILAEGTIIGSDKKIDLSKFTNAYTICVGRQHFPIPKDFEMDWSFN